MGSTITYKDLYLSFGEIISIDRLYIEQTPGMHAKLNLSAILDGEKDSKAFDELPDMISVLYMQDGEEKILFKGKVTDSSVRKVGKHIKTEVKAYDATCILDTKKKTRSFQDIERTNHSVIDEVMEEYPQSICMKNIPQEVIGRIWFQYEETDWEFLRRFMSAYSQNLYADATYCTARFQAGLSPVDIDADWDNEPYVITKNLENYDYLSENGAVGLSSEQFMEYTIESHDVYTIGSRINYKGAAWYIASLKRQIKEGVLINTYELRQKEGLMTLKQYNMRITGISVDGRITDVKGNKVRVEIEGDMTVKQGTYWFPFSTVAASGDGSGWFSMPEKGDCIRVYFPTSDEQEGYVITKHESQMPEKGADVEQSQNPMENPDKRNIFTKDGCVIQMIPKGVVISAGKSSITMNKNGEVIFNAPMGLNFYAGESIMINGRNIEMEAATGIDIKDESGANVKITKSSIRLRAKEIFEN